MPDLHDIQLMDNEYLFHNYGDRLPVAFNRVCNDRLYDISGKEYIDFLAGISVTNIGGDNDAFVKRLHTQIDSLIHSSNWFYNIQQIEAAKRISDLSFKGKTLFVNSGTEANEAAIKIARKYGQSRDENCYNIIVFSHSFHGRTFGAMSATGNEKIRSGFGPVVPGFIYLPFNDEQALNDALEKHNVCAVMTELIQGEGGINLIDADFCRLLERKAREYNALFIIDEVQTGIARTGRHFVYQHFNIQPDIITLAKGLGNGIPVGAVHAKDDVAAYLTPGSHGTTFGGNHLACAAADTVLETIAGDGFLDSVNALSDTAFQFLHKMKEKTPVVREIRGLGLHIGVQLTRDGAPYVKKALEEGLVINCTAGNVLRIMPPLTIAPDTLVQGLEIFQKLMMRNDI